MANNAIFARLSNLWTGFISLWVSDIEKEHPEIAYQNAIASMIQKYTQLKAATGAIIARRQDITSRLEAAERELASVSADLETALATNQDDLAVVLIQKKNALDTALTDLRADAAQATADSDNAKDSLMQVKTEIDKLKAEKDRMLAQMHSAQARIKIQGQLDGLSVDAEVDLGPVGQAYGVAVRMAIGLPGMDRDAAQKLIDAAHQVCPYSNATRGNIPVELTLA